MVIRTTEQPKPEITSESIALREWAKRLEASLGSDKVRSAPKILEIILSKRYLRVVANENGNPYTLYNLPSKSEYRDLSDDSLDSSLARQTFADLQGVSRAVEGELRNLTGESSGP